MWYQHSPAGGEKKLSTNHSLLVDPFMNGNRSYVYVTNKSRVPDWSPFKPFNLSHHTGINYIVLFFPVFW